MSPIDENVFATDLIHRWDRLFAFRGSATKENTRAAASHLVGAYQQSGRHHHRLGHIVMIRSELGLTKTTDGPELEFTDKKGVELAVDVHDVVQGLTPEFDINDSERWIKTLLLAWDIDPTEDFPSLIPCLRATEHDPNRVPETSDAMLVADADLAILGQSDNVYKQYMTAVRAEFRWVPDKLFTAARIKVLDHFMDRPQIYWTDYFKDQYEERARENIADELLKLKGMSGKPTRAILI